MVENNNNSVTKVLFNKDKQIKINDKVDKGCCIQKYLFSFIVIVVITCSYYSFVVIAVVLFTNCTVVTIANQDF